MQLELIQMLIFFLTGGFLVFMAITITRDNYHILANRAAGAMLFFAGLGPLALALGHVIQSASAVPTGLEDTTLYDFHYVWEFFFPALVIFSWLFPIDRLKHFRRPGVRYVVIIPQLIHLSLVLLYQRLVTLLNVLVERSAGADFTGAVLKPFTWVFQQVMLAVAYARTNEQVIFGLINIGYIVVAIYFLESGRRGLTNPRLQSQTRLVVWGMRLGLGLYTLAYLGLTFLTGGTLEALAPYLLIGAVVVGGGFITNAIIRHQFLNVQLLFRQSLVNTLVSSILVGLYILAGVRSRAILQPIFGAQTDIVRYLFIILILLLFQPISTWIDNVIRSMFMRTRTDYRNIMERFSRQVINIFQPRQLRQAIEEIFKTSLLVDRVYFVLYDDSVQEYAILESDDYPRRTVIDREDLMLRGINLLDSPTQFSSLSAYEDGSRLAEILNEQQVRIILPLKDAQHLLGFVALSTKSAGYRYTSEDLNLLGVLSNQMVTALTNARLYADSLERLRLEEEVNMARQIQLDLLPSKPPECSISVISASSTPSRTVGGDFYDFIAIDENRLGIVIADASGKGMPAALMVTQIQAILRSEVNNGNSIKTVLKNMNQQVVASTSSEKYVTLFYAELDLRTCILSFANAGHNYPVLVRSNGEVELLIEGGPVIGAFPFIEYASSSVQLRPDDILFFFTDGLSEAMDTAGVEYGEDRIRSFVAAHRAETPDEIIRNLLADVRRHDPTNPPQDDTTIITIKMTNGAGHHGE
jgi:sigma-B regulation protein RsbU (phosphoserine phosphatase)